MKTITFKPLLYSLTVFFLTMSCQKAEDNLKKQDTIRESLAVFTNINTLYSEDAHLKIKLEAPQQVIEHSGDVFYPKGVSILTYDELGVTNSSLRSDSARYQKNESLYLAKGNVVVQNYEKKQQAYTEEIYWNQKDRKIYTEKAIKIITPYETIEGVGMTSDETFSNYKIWKVKGSFELREKSDSTAAQQEALPAETSKAKK